MRPTSTAFALAAALGCASAVLADGGHDAHGAAGMDHSEDFSRFGQPGDPKAADRTVTIKATEIVYDLARLDVKEGETITLVLENDGEQDHELGVGDHAFFDAHRAMMEGMPGMHHAMANMVTAAPGKSAALTWTFTKPGTFEFACAITGHYEAGMKGAITVR